MNDNEGVEGCLIIMGEVSHFMAILMWTMMIKQVSNFGMPYLITLLRIDLWNMGDDRCWGVFGCVPN